MGWKVGNNAGGAFRPDGDLWTATWVTTPKGRPMILMMVVGFRDTPEGRRKVIVDRWVEEPPVCYGRAKS
jgi:hypothetical protein